MHDAEGIQYEVEIEIKDLKFLKNSKEEDQFHWISYLWKNACTLWKAASNTTGYFKLTCEPELIKCYEEGIGEVKPTIGEYLARKEKERRDGRNGEESKIEEIRSTNDVTREIQPEQRTDENKTEGDQIELCDSSEPDIDPY